MAFKKTAGTPIAGLGSSTGELLNLEADETTGALKVATYVWDSDLLQWVRAAQGGGGDAGFTAEDTLFEWDSDGNPLYKGMNATAGAAQSDPSWRVAYRLQRSERVARSPDEERGTCLPYVWWWLVVRGSPGHCFAHCKHHGRRCVDRQWTEGREPHLRYERPWVIDRRYPRYGQPPL